MWCQMKNRWSVTLMSIQLSLLSLAEKQVYLWFFTRAEWWLCFSSSFGRWCHTHWVFGGYRSNHQFIENLTWSNTLLTWLLELSWFSLDFHWLRKDSNFWDCYPSMIVILRWLLSFDDCSLFFIITLCELWFAQTWYLVDSSLGLTLFNSSMRNDWNKLLSAQNTLLYWNGMDSNWLLFGIVILRWLLLTFKMFSSWIINLFANWLNSLLDFLIDQNYLLLKHFWTEMENDCSMLIFGIMMNFAVALSMMTLILSHIIVEGITLATHRWNEFHKGLLFMA